VAFDKVPALNQNLRRLTQFLSMTRGETPMLKDRGVFRFVYNTGQRPLACVLVGNKFELRDYNRYTQKFGRESWEGLRDVPRPMSDPPEIGNLVGKVCQYVDEANRTNGFAAEYRKHESTSAEVSALEKVEAIYTDLRDGYLHELLKYVGTATKRAATLHH
jgi:hypothetical protein